MLPGTRNGRSSSGSREAQAHDGDLRRGERDQDAEAVEAREERHRVVRRPRDQEHRGGDQGGRRDRRRRDQRRPGQAAEGPRQHVVPGERIGEPARAGEGGRDHGDEDHRAGDADEHPEGVDQDGRKLAAERDGEPDERRLEPLRAQSRLGIRGEGGERDKADEERDRDRGADSDEEAPRQRSARLTGLRSKVRDGLEPGVREHRDGDREGDRAPGRSRPQVGALAEVLEREEKRQAEDDEQQLRGQRDACDRDREPVEARTADEAHRGDGEDDSDPHEDVGRALRQCFPADRMAQVVRDEERCERDHDQVVEEDRPAGEEAQLVVERPPDERRGPTGLRKRRGSLGVRESDDQEQSAHPEQDPGREAERLERDDTEREEERGRDLSESDRGQRGSLEDALQPGSFLATGRPPSGAAPVPPRFP